MHTFPADGEYRFRVSFYHETTGALYGNGRAALHTAEAPEQVEISIDGERVALLDIDRWMNTSDPDGVNLRTDPIAITAGPHRVSGGVHPPHGRAGAGSDLAARVVAGEHEHRRRLRLHDAAAPARHGDHRPVRRDRRVADAEPAQHLHVPPENGTAAGDGLRARDRVAPGVAGVPAHRRPSAIVNALDGALYERRGRGRLRGRACAWRSKASSRARASCSASRSGRPPRAPAATYALSDDRPGVAAVVLPLGDAARTRSC